MGGSWGLFGIWGVWRDFEGVGAGDPVEFFGSPLFHVERARAANGIDGASNTRRIRFGHEVAGELIKMPRKKNTAVASSAQRRSKRLASKAMAVAETAGGDLAVAEFNTSAFAASSALQPRPNSYGRWYQGRPSAGKHALWRSRPR